MAARMASASWACARTHPSNAAAAQSNCTLFHRHCRRRAAYRQWGKNPIVPGCYIGRDTPVQQLVPVIFVFGLGLAGVLLGMWLEQIPRVSRLMLLLSGGLLVTISLLLVAPELAENYGWTGGLLWMALGFVALWLVNRYVYPLCPSCAHNHNHDACTVPLHGFAAPLVLASGLHSFMDGWSLVASRQNPSQALQFAFLLGVTLHKLPEGLALGTILRASLRSRWRVAGGGALAQFMTVVGGAVALWLAPWAGARWSGVFLGLAGGTFLYLGYHTLEAEFERRATARGVASHH